jgi:fructose-1-phosphate kinase PfkB-like protein
MSASISVPAAPHIYTLTGNLLAERTQDFAAWTPGKTQRALSESFQVGGKGINVSKMLTRLGDANTALCFPGGASGAECTDWLRARGFSFHPFPTQSPTRTGLVVRADGRPETTFLGPDSPPDATAFRACADYLDALPDNTVLALCGSFPAWDTAGAEPLRSALERLVTRGTLCADTYGPPLAWIVQRPVALVKINRHEFDSLLPDSPHRSPPGIRLTEAAARWPVQRWIVTDGPHDVSAVERSTQPSPASSQRPPHVAEISATGSGDVFFACVLHALITRRLSLTDAISFALPFAAANTAHLGIADFPLNQLPQTRSLSP